MRSRSWTGFSPGLRGMLAAGLVGISANTILLEAAPLLKLNPGAGGILQLMLAAVRSRAPALLPSLQRLGLTRPPSLFGFLWYHYLTGLGMILLYFLVLHRRLAGPRWWRGTLFSFVPWAINAAFVLPRLGQGFAGLRVLSWSGALYFFVANWLFVVVSAICYRDEA